MKTLYKLAIIFSLLLYAVISSNTVAATTQKIPAELSINTMNESALIPLFANQVLADNTQEKRPLRERIALHIVAKNYTKASALIDELTEQSRTLNPWVTELFTIHLRSYVDAKINQTRNHYTFEKAFSKALFKSYKKIDRRYSVYAIDSFAGNVDRQEKQLSKLLTQLKSKQTLNQDDKKKLVLQFNAWSRLKQTQPLAKQLLKQEEQKSLITLENQIIKTKGGASLQATVYLPKNAEEKLPSLLLYNLYAEGWSIDNKAKEAAMSGYAGVLVYSRGKGTSQDSILPYEHEATDAYDIIEWISQQSWSNEKVGMYGGSYLGFTQWAATKKLHPALKTIVPSTAVVPGLNDNLTENGVLNTGSLPWFHLVGNNSTMDFATYYDPRWDKTGNNWYQKGHAFKDLDKIDDHPNALFQRWLKHDTYDEYWQKMVPYKSDFTNINIPVLSITGYFDHAQHGSLYYFNQHNKYNTNAEHYLLIGPYDHLGASSMPRPNVSGYQMDPLAHISIDKVIYQWFDYVLKGATKPSLLKNKVNYQVMGTNQWQHVDSIKAMSKDSQKFYLDVTNPKNKSLLIKDKPIELSHIEQSVDFSDRTTTNHSLTSRVLHNKIYVDNGFEFVSEPVKESFITSGQFSGRLNVTINKKDFDFVAVLYELQLDGQYFQLSHFKGRASRLNSMSKRALLTPGKKEKLAFVNTHIISKIISKGSRLVLVLNANKNNQDQINYGTGKNVSEETIDDAKEPLKIQWWNDSFINIPMKLHH
jgi:putative CocE/NonD family hydrolase